MTRGASPEECAEAGASVDLAPPANLMMAPGYGARRLHQAYLAAWARHVDRVLTGPQFAVLCVVRAYPGSDQSSLAGAAALDTSTMADVCRRLERRGLIRRTESRQDARRKLLALTNEGEVALTEVEQKVRRLEQALFAVSGVDEIELFATRLHEVGAAWESVAQLESLD